MFVRHTAMTEANAQSQRRLATSGASAGSGSGGSPMHAMLTKSATFANLVSTQQNVHAAVATNDQLRKQYGLPTAEELQAGYQEARRNIIEMMVYGVFVSLFTFATLFGRNDQQLFFWTDGVREQLTEIEFPLYASHVDKSFNDVATVDEFWQWALGPGYNALYTASTFDGDHEFPGSPGDGEAADDNLDPRLNWPSHILGSARLLGGVRFGQIRSSEADCSSHPNLGFNDEPPRCFTRVDERDPDEPVPEIGYPEPIPGLQKGAEDEEPPFRSYVTSMWYGAPTVYVELPNRDPHPGPLESYDAQTDSPVITRLRELRDGKFIDLHTRAVLIDAVLYNPSLDYLMLVRITAEMPVVGGVVPSHKFAALRLYRYFTGSDILRLAAEVAVLAMVCGYWYVELKTLKSKGIRRYATIDSIPHLLNLSLFIVSNVLKFLSWLTLPGLVDPTQDGFLNYRWSAFYFELAQDVMAFNAFLSWTKVVKYLNFIPRFKILLGTLKYASGKVGGFTIICGVVLFGSAQSFVLAFGTNLYGFRNLTQSFFTLARALLGDFEFEPLREVAPFLGPLLFFLFIMLAVFVLLNMFIAIISDSFNETKEVLASADMSHGKIVTKALGQILFTDGLYRWPIVGKLLQRAMESRENIVRQRLARATQGDDVTAILELADDNASGVVSAEELLKFLGDADGVGYVSTEDVASALVKMGMAEKEAAETAEALDANKNGRIEMDELAPLLLGAGDAAMAASVRGLSEKAKEAKSASKGASKPAAPKEAPAFAELAAMQASDGAAAKQSDEAPDVEAPAFNGRQAWDASMDGEATAELEASGGAATAMVAPARLEPIKPRPSASGTPEGATIGQLKSPASMRFKPGLTRVRDDAARAIRLRAVADLRLKAMSEEVAKRQQMRAAAADPVALASTLAALERSARSTAERLDALVKTQAKLDEKLDRLLESRST